MEEEQETLNIAPKWVDLLPLYADWYCNGVESQHDLAVKEFKKVGEILDGINDGKYTLVKNGEEEDADEN